MGQGTLSQFITSLTLLLVSVESSFRHVIAHCRVVISLLVLVRVHSVEASYRHVSLSSRDLCRPSQTSNLYNRLSAPALKTIQLDQVNTRFSLVYHKTILISDWLINTRARLQFSVSRPTMGKFRSASVISK